jgi:four helix bundle protein
VVFNSEAPHRRLKVWQKSLLLLRAMYLVSKSLPPSERFELSTQMRRAAWSILLNIAEGSGRRTRVDYAHFLGMARGSAREVSSQLEGAVVCELVARPMAEEAVELSDEVSRMLTAMILKLDPP